MSPSVRRLISLAISLALLILTGNQLSAQDDSPAEDMDLVDRLIETKFSTVSYVRDRVPRRLTGCLGPRLRFTYRGNDDDDDTLVLMMGSNAWMLRDSGFVFYNLETEYEVRILPHEEDDHWLLEFNGIRLQIDGESMHILTEDGELVVVPTEEVLPDDMTLVDRLVERTFGFPHAAPPELAFLKDDDLSRHTELCFAHPENGDNGDLVAVVTHYDGINFVTVTQEKYQVSILPHEKDGCWLLEFNGIRLLFDSREYMAFWTEDGEFLVGPSNIKGSERIYLEPEER